MSIYLSKLPKTGFKKELVGHHFSLEQVLGLKVHVNVHVRTVVYREIETVFGLERIPVLFVQIKSVQND